MPTLMRRKRGVIVQSRHRVRGKQGFARNEVKAGAQKYIVEARNWHENVLRM